MGCLNFLSKFGKQNTESFRYKFCLFLLSFFVGTNTYILRMKSLNFSSKDCEKGVSRGPCT